MKVMKFGGTSVKDADRIRDVAALLKREDLSEGLVVVCSAMKGITDDLIKVGHEAESGKVAPEGPSYAATVESIWLRVETGRKALLGDTAVPLLDELHGELNDIAHGIFLVRECTPRSLDLLMSFGERFNNCLIAAYLRSVDFDAVYVDARTCVLTDDGYGSAMVDFAGTNGKITAYFREIWKSGPVGKVAVVTGFIGANADGITTTLGRNGSDYTASIFGAALGAGEIEIWTDVDGVLSADPRVVKKAFVIPELSVEEAMEMCYFGAEVLHPYTIIPAVERGIPIWIKNTMNSSAIGTKIAADVKPGTHTITGLASIKKVALITVQGGGMMGTKGIASRIFAALAKAEANVIMISQASSEHSICVVLRSDECDKALSVLKAELSPFLQSRVISSVDLAKNLEIVAVIGANMKGRPGVSGRLFGALGAAGINVLVIAQGSSEMNISFVIEQKDHVQALNVVHEAFFEG